MPVSSIICSATMKAGFSVLLLVFLIERTVSVEPHKYCYKEYPILDGLLCYPECDHGYSHWGGGPLCWGKCPQHTTDFGLFCVKHTYGRGVGNPLSSCFEEDEKNGLLCYPDCNDGFYGVGPLCWAYCQKGYADHGALCHRDTHIYGRDVSSCPWYDKCGLCAGPWYNVCSKRRDCGGPCAKDYHDDGCTCRRDVHIYAKETYGRGVGSPMICAPGEEQDGALCYKSCDDGYYGVGPVCWASCSGETIDTGTQCQKKTYGRGVGKIVNCLKLPSINDITNFNGLVNMFKKSSGFEHLEAVGCATLYGNIKLWLALIQTFNGCFSQGDWQTMSISYTAGVSALGEMAGEIGIAVDTKTTNAMCYVGYCYGVNSDVSLGVGLAITHWRRLSDVPGESKAIEMSFDIPFTDIGGGVSSIVNTDGEYIGTQFTFGVGIGGPVPINFGAANCYTPENQTIPFTV